MIGMGSCAQDDGTEIVLGGGVVEESTYPANSPPRELCLVTPSCRRAWDDLRFRPVQAGKAYTGPFSRKCQTYAERFYPGSWCILDARYGFLYPDEVIRKGHGACLFRPWTEPLTLEELRAQVRRRRLDSYERITVMGGRRFIFLVEEAFPGRRVRAPLVGVGGIGDMMHTLNEALATGLKL